MTRLQYWILVSLSALLGLLLLLQVIFSRAKEFEDMRSAQAQQLIAQGNECNTRWQQVATRIYQVGNQTQDQSLKDILIRQQITVKSPAGGTNETSAPAH